MPKHSLAILCAAVILSACGGDDGGTTTAGDGSSGGGSGITSQSYSYPQDPRIKELGTYVVGDPVATESTPVVWNNQVISILWLRPSDGESSIQIENINTGEVLANVPLPDFYLGSAIVVGETLYVLGTTGFSPTTTVSAAGNTVIMIATNDLVNWTQPVTLLQAEPDEAIYNTSVTATPMGYLLAYDCTGTGITSTAQRFATSPDMQMPNWSRVGVTFSASTYSTGVTIRYIEGYYYLFHTILDTLPVNGFDFGLAVKVTRSQDLVNLKLPPG